jgi:hypothetical protein
VKLRPEAMGGNTSDAAIDRFDVGEHQIRG